MRGGHVQEGRVPFRRLKQYASHEKPYFCCPTHTLARELQGMRASDIQVPLPNAQKNAVWSTVPSSIRVDGLCPTDDDGL